MASAEKDKKLIAANPLVQDRHKLVPSVTRVFRKDQDMYVYLEAYQPAAEQTRLVVATVTFYRGDVKAFETAPLTVTTGLDAKSKAVPVSFTVPLGIAGREIHLPGERRPAIGAEVRGLARADRADTVRRRT